MLNLLLVVGLLFCAVQAIRAVRLLVSAVWLAGLSICLAIFLYAVGALEIAVIELSVGIGLVTVLIVFAFAITGEEVADVQLLFPRAMAWGLVLVATALLAWMIIPWPGAPPSASERSFVAVLWEQRGLDVLVQVVLIFTGVLGVLRILADHHLPSNGLLEQTAATPTLEEGRSTLRSSSEHDLQVEAEIEPEEVNV